MAGAPAAVRLVLGLLIATALEVAIVVVRPRADLSVFPTWRLVLDLALLALPAVLTLDLALRPGARGSRWRRSLPAALVFTVIGAVGVALLPSAHTLHPESTLGMGVDFVPRALACFTVGGAMTLVVVGLLRWLTVSGRSPLSFLALLAAGTLVAMVGLHLHCPLTHPVHLWSGHVSVLIVALSGGVAALWRRPGMVAAVTRR